MFRADAELRLFLLRRAFSKIRVEALAMVWGSLLGKELADCDFSRSASGRVSARAEHHRYLDGRTAEQSCTFSEW